ncbi:MAG: S1C family serine protease [Lachnospiraceae bacterium]|nr:S1C family serine protease [Lachnospiraceae bacterium]
MSEQHNENNDYQFLREKINERPINRRKVFKQSLLTIALAITFALVACFIFFFFEQGIIEGFSKEKESAKIQLNLQETTEEILPEDMIQSEDAPVPDSPLVIIPDNSNKIADALAAYEPDIDDYQGIFNKMKTVAQEANKSIVSVKCIEDKTNWLNAQYESTTRATGIILEDNGTDLFIVTDASIIKEENNIIVTFLNNAECIATLKTTNTYTNLAILTIPLADINDNTKETIVYASFGNSKYGCKPGDIVMAIGDPYGYGSSVGYGTVTSTGNEIQTLDKNFELLTTDIFGSENANGVLINKSGKIVGIITQKYNKSEFKNMISAVGINELAPLMEDLCNDVSNAHMGVKVTNVSSVAMNYYGVPMGAYVTDIALDSPAMNSGIHKGDVIVAINDAVISSVVDYELELKDYSPEDNVTVSVMRPNGDTYIDMDLKVTLTD